MLLFAWGSRSISSVSLPRKARAAARLIAVVVFPTPPFWFAMARIILEGVPARACQANHHAGRRRRWCRRRRLSLKARASRPHCRNGAGPGQAVHVGGWYFAWTIVATATKRRRYRKCRP